MFAKVARWLSKSSDAGGERYRKAALTSVMNVASQFIQLATGLISVPLALSYVGVERFGIWMTLSTALAFITFTDFGVGIGLQDRMSRLLGANFHALAAKSFSSSLLFVIGLFLLLQLASVVIAPQLDFVSVLSLKSKEAIADIVPTTQTMVLILGLGLVSGIVQRAFNALQEGFWVAAIQAIARLISLLLLFVVVKFEMGLPTLVFVVGGVSSAAILLVGYPLLLLRHRWLVPDRIAVNELFDKESFSEIMRVGILGLGASVAIYLVNNSIPVLISTKYGADSVADYAVLLKLLSIPTLLLTYLLIPLWPAIAEANATGDKLWIKRLYGKCLKVTILVAASSSILFLLGGRELIQLWTRNDEVVPSYGLLLASVSFMALGLWNALTSVMLNGLSRYRSQALYGLLIAVVFAVLAAFVPDSYVKEVIIWVVSAGFFLRCAMMQYEVSTCMRQS